MLEVPSLIRIPVGPHLDGLRIIIDGLGLSPLLVIAGVPLVVAVCIEEAAQKVFAGLKIVEVGPSCVDVHLANDFLVRL